MKHTAKTLEKNYISKRLAKFHWTFIKLSVLSIVFTFLFASHLFSDRAFSQSNIKIEGYDYDQENGYPVTGAEIRITNTSYRVYSDNTGFFFFAKLPVGSYSLDFYSQRLNATKHKLLTQANLK